MCLGAEEVTKHCNVLDTNVFDIVIRTDFLRCCICNSPMLYIATSTHAFFLSLWSCKDEKKFRLREPVSST